MNATASSIPANPFRAGSDGERRPGPTTVVIFGAAGDLAKRKLLPALASLGADRLLPPDIKVVGFSRALKTDDAFRAEMRAACDAHARRRPIDAAVWDAFAASLHYQAGHFDDPASYTALAARLREVEGGRSEGRARVIYLAVPPESYPSIIEHLARAGLVSRGGSAPNLGRVVFEKPFGVDLESAVALNRAANAHIQERDIFRIDHYLGKETVQNLLVFRFGNGIFEPVWNQKYVDHVQITVGETLGVESRGAYFDAAGILRDIVQNHMFQLLALTAMEPPVAFEANAVRNEKTKVLAALRPLRVEEVPGRVVRGQYGFGAVAGHTVPGYRQEPKVSPASTTDTFAALRVDIDNWRWAGVPFYLRAGKRMPKRVSEISIHWKEVPHLLFRSIGCALPEGNVLGIRIQPDEGISLKFGSKIPGPNIEIHPVTMEFRYGTSFGAEPPEAYERLLLDAMLGDPTLFIRSDEVEAAWAWLAPVFQSWAESPAPDFPNYEAGTWGPDAAVDLLARDDRFWRTL